MTQWTIKQLLPNTEDWFYLAVEYLPEPEPNRWLMTPVTCWASVFADNEVDHVLPVGDGGMLVTSDIHEDITLVCGRNPSPFGMTWRELYEGLVEKERNLYSTHVNVPTELVRSLERSSDAT